MAETQSKSSSNSSYSSSWTCFSFWVASVDMLMYAMRSGWRIIAKSLFRARPSAEPNSQSPKSVRLYVTLYFGRQRRLIVVSYLTHRHSALLVVCSCARHGCQSTTSATSDARQHVIKLGPRTRRPKAAHTTPHTDQRAPSSHPSFDYDHQ